LILLPHDGQSLGLSGFGASAHLGIKTVKHLCPHTKVFVFARAAEERSFADSLGADWCGATDDEPPEPLDAIIDTTPAWTPILKALEVLKPGGRLVINAIRKEPQDQSCLQELDYARHLWMEKEVKSVANITRKDVEAFLHLAGRIPIQPEVTYYQLEEGKLALQDMKHGGTRGARVLRVSQDANS
jgi:propanol-preferring alcohol dehydrogenase